MKHFFLIILSAVLITVTSSAQDMNTVLKNTFINFDTTAYNDVESKTSISNRLGLISKKWKDDWAAHYYNAYAKAQMSYLYKEMEKRDALVDEAETELQEAIALLGNENDETYVMKAMLAQARMVVDGKNRWQKYGKIFSENLDKAKELNEKNPRIYHLKGTSVFYTPKMFGGGAKNAKPYFEKAAEYFALENDSDMKDPFWGKRANEWFLIQVAEKLSKKKKDDHTEEQE